MLTPLLLLLRIACNILSEIYGPKSKGSLAIEETTINAKTVEKRVLCHSLITLQFLERPDTASPCRNRIPLGEYEPVEFVIKILIEAQSPNKISRGRESAV